MRKIKKFLHLLYRLHFSVVKTDVVKTRCGGKDGLKHKIIETSKCRITERPKKS